MSDDFKVYRQVEQTAGLYGAATYTGLLDFFHDFQVTYEQGEFIPITSVRTTRDRERLLFIIGVIPPSANVTGRLLDRSASVLSVNGQEPGESASADAAAGAGGGAPSTPPAGNGPDPVTGTGGRAAGSHRNARQTLIDAFTEVMGRPPSLAELQYAHAIAWLETNYGNGWKGAMVGSNNWGAVHCPANAQDAPGCISYEDSHPNGKKFKVSFKSYKTPKDGAKDLIKHIFVHRGKTAQSLAQGGPIFNASYAMRREKYYGGFCREAAKEHGAQVNASLADPDRNAATQACAEEAITAHANLVKSLVDQVAAANGDPTALGLGSYDAAAAWWSAGQPNGGAVSGDSNGGNWPGQGSGSAQDAAKERSKGTPLNSTDVGRKFQAAQQAQIAETQAALAAMASVPPLKMLVNPSKFSVKGEKITNDGNWGRSGPIVQHWGDGQDKISASGKVAAFYAIDSRNAGGPGLTRHARNFSESYANFQALYALYRNNGGLYLRDPLTGGKTKNLSHVGSVYIYYDSVMYIGSFDSFNVTEADTAPFTLEYSFEFTVRAAFLLDRNDDQVSYGAPGLIPTAAPAPVTDPFDSPMPYKP